jgi:hypothetical protein
MLHTSTMKRNGILSSEKFVLIYQTARYYNTEDLLWYIIYTIMILTLKNSSYRQYFMNISHFTHKRCHD